MVGVGVAGFEPSTAAPGQVGGAVQGTARSGTVERIVTGLPGNRCDAQGDVGGQVEGAAAEHVTVVEDRRQHAG